MADVTLHAEYARSSERAGPLAARLGAAASTDLAVLLADPTLDAVDVCLPTPAHPEAVLAALAAGKHVFCDTPLALAVEDAERLRLAALVRYPAAGAAEAVRIDGHDPHARECREFVACLRGEADPELRSADRALEALRISVAVQRSLASGAPVAP